MDVWKTYVEAFEGIINFLGRYEDEIRFLLSVLWIIFFEILYFTGATEVRALFVILIVPVGVGFGFLTFGLLMFAVMATGLGGVIAFFVAVLGSVIYGTYKLIQFLYITIVWTNAI